MSLSWEQLELIKLIDNKVKAIILNGGTEEEVLVSLLDKMPKIKTIIILLQILSLQKKKSIMIDILVFISM